MSSSFAHFTGYPDIESSVIYAGSSYIPVIKFISYRIKAYLRYTNAQNRDIYRSILPKRFRANTKGYHIIGISLSLTHTKREIESTYLKEDHITYTATGGICHTSRYKSTCPRSGQNNQSHQRSYHAETHSAPRSWIF